MVEEKRRLVPPLLFHLLSASYETLLPSRAKNESDTLDLHGLTVTEACTIVRETLQHSPPSPGNTLKIITGRGNHSTNQIGVLGPAVREMLIREGYSVSKWDGGLVVKGLR